MKKARLLYIFFLIAGLILLFNFSRNSLTGAVIGKNVLDSSRLSLVLGIGLIFSAFLVYFSGENLEKKLKVLVIPTGRRVDDEKRTNAAVRNYNETKESDSDAVSKNYILVTGKMERDDSGKIKKDSQQYEIYTRLRRQGIKPIEMIIEPNAEDTLDNFVYTAKKLKEKAAKEKADEIEGEIFTSRPHSWRFKLSETEARKRGLIDDSIKFKPNYTKSTLFDYIYGIAAYVKDWRRMSSTNELEEKFKSKD